MDAGTLVVVTIITAAGLAALVVGLIPFAATHWLKKAALITDRESIVLGTTTALHKFSLSHDEQTYHAVIFGRTGSGKSRLLEAILLQHLNLGRGVGLIEPHHDLSFDTLAYLVSKGFFAKTEAFNKLVYIDWGNGAYVPFNILAPDGHIDANSRALNALDAMTRCWPELEQAPTFQTLFLSAVSALIENGLPITYLYQLLTDADFRAACLANVNDPLIHQTFENYYDKLGRDQTQEAGSTLRRAFLLSFSPYARLTLGQSECWLPFREWLDQGKAIIINLGNINDHETRRLIGAMLMVQLEQAALSRTDIPPAKRTPFTLLVDEWPAFAAQEKTIGTVLSQTRKFNFRLYLAAQNLSQVGSARLSGALENCKLQIAFGLGRESAEIQAKHVGSADPFMVKEEAFTQNQHAQYLSIPEQFEAWTQQLQNLEPRHAYVKLEGKPAVCIKTVGMPDADPDPQQIEQVLATYSRQYQRTKKEAEAAIANIALPGATGAQGYQRPNYKRGYQRP
jgi:hypothetical protein